MRSTCSRRWGGGIGPGSHSTPCTGRTRWPRWCEAGWSTISLTAASSRRPCVPARDSTGGGAAPAGATADRPVARRTASIRLLKPAPPVARLAAALVARGHTIDRGTSAPGAGTWVVGPAEDPDTAAHIAGRSATGDRILVLGWIGAHPDARAETLRKLWALEERCRATPLPTLALRLGPLVGPASPLW